MGKDFEKKDFSGVEPEDASTQEDELTGGDRHYPGKNDNRKIIGSGGEHVVYDENELFVVKEINSLDHQTGNAKDPNIIEVQQSPEFLKWFEEDQATLKEIFKERLVKMYTTTSPDEDGDKKIKKVQEKIVGKSVDEAIAELGDDGREKFIEQNREELLHLVYGIKKGTAELGIPIDIHRGNVRIDQEDNKIKVIDLGAPSAELKLLPDFPDEKKKQEKYKQIVGRYKAINRLESELGPTQSEKNRFSEEYDYREEDESEWCSTEQGFRDTLASLR